MSGTARIAVIGAGPKGTYCLDSLAIELGMLPERPDIEVHVFEPHPAPGAGPVYDPSQPDYLRMNFDNDKIDMWNRRGTVASAEASFVDYLDQQGHAADPAGYAARAQVGRYLTDGFSRIIERLSQNAGVHLHPTRVTSVTRAPAGAGGYVVHGADELLTCDEVLLATGHASRQSPPSDAIAAYPVDRPDGVHAIAPGAHVAVRGFGLTAIDVALALTEGRGGRFEPSSPGRFRYHGSATQVSRILPFSRTGRPMVPKPHPTLGPSVPNRAELLDVGLERLEEAVDTVDPATAVEGELIRTASELLATASPSVPRGDATTAVQEHVGSLLDRNRADPRHVRSAMAADLEVAMGLRAPGPDWALGEAWRLLYPAFVSLVETRALDRSWPRFAALAIEMERVAFGPPAENAARLLALVDAGIVDLACCADPHIIDAETALVLEGDSARRSSDVLVDAVIAPAGAAPGSSPVIAALVAAGLARITAHSAGIDVLADGTCVAADGSPSEGLAAVGRPTEGSVLGNDTLSRTLHAIPERWARRVALRLKKVAVPA